MAENKEDIEEQRRLAKDWRPEVGGPIVGPLSPTTDFLVEFPESDSRHEKIRNLALSLPHYRSMKRDGSCGYRALIFGYLYQLCQPTAPSSPSSATTRLQAAGKHFSALQSLFKPRGWDAFIYEDWLAACEGLCQDLEKAAAAEEESDGGQTGAGACGKVLEKCLNDDETSVEIIQYLRAVTSSWMLAHEDDFAPFVLGTGAGDSVKAWCELNVDPPAAEMEEQSLLAFYKAVVERSGMSIHVHYLERSAGDRLQVAEYEPAEQKAGENAGQVIHLLYRPGHYDLLLKS